MKVAIVTYALQVGGVERFIYNISKYLISHGYEVEVIEAENRGIWKGYFIQNGIPVSSITTNLLTIPYLHSARLARKLKEFDTVFLVDVPLAQAALGLLPENTACFPVIQLSISSFYTNAVSNNTQWNAIVGVSNQIRERLLHEFKIEPARVFMIPNSIFVGNYPEKEFNLDQEIKIVFAGRIENNQKGVFLLPEIMKQLIIKYPQSRLTVIGDGPDLGSLKEITNYAKIIDHLHFEGNMPNEKVREKLKQFHFLLLPSNQEGLPFVLLEGMSAGVIPVVSYLHGITDMVIRDGENGYFAIPGNAESFSGSLEKAIENSENLNLISHKAYQTVIDNFNMKKAGGQFTDLMNNPQPLLHGRSGKINIAALPYRFPFLPVIAGKVLNKVFRKQIRPTGI
jgi:glycosyltransferase involved in cell wall biosynthesis